MITVKVEAKFPRDDFLCLLFADGDLIDPLSYTLVDVRYNEKTKEVIVEAKSNP